MKKFPQFIRLLLLLLQMLASGAALADPNLLAVQSRKIHGSAGQFDINLDLNAELSGAVTVEPRVIGTANGIGHTLVFQFDTPITGFGMVSAVGGSGQPVGFATASFAGNEITVTLTSIPDNFRLTTTLTGVNGSAVVKVSAGFLIGDVNSTRSVNASDISAIKARSGQSVNAGNFRFDLNASGAINVSDISTAKSRSGRAIPQISAALTMNFAGAGVGIVNSSPSGINCAALCTSYFGKDTTVTLNAVPGATSVFTGWSGACTGASPTTTLMLSVDSTCTATFAVLQAALTVTLAGGGAGNVTSTPAGINCGTTCTSGFNPGAFILLTATETAGSTFTGWSGACSGTAPNTFVMVNGATTCTARFVLPAAADISGRVVVSQDTATPVAGARIVDRLTGAVLAITDPAGNFQINGLSMPSGPPLQVSISADGYLTRETGLQPGTQGVVADIIKLSPPFSLQYYRQLVRPVSDGSDQRPGFALGGWRAETMNVYIRTNLIDPTDRTRAPIDTGVAVSQVVINRVLNGLEKTIAEIAGGTVTVGLVEFGPEAAHENQSGWLAIDFFDRETHPQPDYAGIAGSPPNGSAMVRLGVHASALFTCAPMHQGLAMHELGHVFGLSHAQLDSPNLMIGGGGNMPCADTHFSPAERLHGRIAYSRPRGNEDPDRDPVGFVLPGARP